MTLSRFLFFRLSCTRFSQFKTNTSKNVVLDWCFKISDSLINDLKLIRPISSIEPRPHIVSVVVTTLGIIMERWWQYGGFMAVICVICKEFLYFIRKNLHIFINFFVIHPIKHRYRSQSLDFTEFTKCTELGICKSHILFIILCDLTFFQRTQFGCRCSS